MLDRWAQKFIPNAGQLSRKEMAIQLLTLVSQQPNENPHRVWISANTLADWIMTGKRHGSFSYTIVIPRPAR